MLQHINNANCCSQINEDEGANSRRLKIILKVVKRITIYVIRDNDELDDHCSKAKVMLHTCGSIRSIIPGIIKAGIEVLNPLQPKAAEMDPEGLYKDFGGKIVFHGGIDIQHIMPSGTPDEFVEHTRSVIKELHGKDGGYILSPAHMVQADVPAENILAMIKAGHNA